jgi:hypothetical protein
MPFEALQLVEKTGSPDPAESGRGVTATITAVYEALRSLAVAGALRVETVKPVSQNAPMVAELSRALRVANGQAPAESLGGMTGRILSPAESIATLHLLATLSAESQAPRISATALMQADTLQKLSITARAPWEFFVFEKEGFVVLVDAATAEALLADEAVALALLDSGTIGSATLSDEAANWLGLTDEVTGSAVLSDDED